MSMVIRAGGAHEVRELLECPRGRVMPPYVALTLMSLQRVLMDDFVRLGSADIEHASWRAWRTTVIGARLWGRPHLITSAAKARVSSKFARFLKPIHMYSRLDSTPSMMFNFSRIISASHIWTRQGLR